MSLRVLILRRMGGETMSDDGLRFPDAFHYQAGIGQRSSNAYFGTDVLSGLVTGMDEFLTDPEGRWRQFRSLGAAVLGCVPWLDDPALLGAIGRFPSACVVVTKQELKKRGREKFERAGVREDLRDDRRGVTEGLVDAEPAARRSAFLEDRRDRSRLGRLEQPFLPPFLVRGRLGGVPTCTLMVAVGWPAAVRQARPVAALQLGQATLRYQVRTRGGRSPYGLKDDEAPGAQPAPRLVPCSADQFNERCPSVSRHGVLPRQHRERGAPAFELF